MDFSKFNMTPPHLKEAMALMAAGRLQEATTLIQNNLSKVATDSHTTDTPHSTNTIRDVTPDISTRQDCAERIEKMAEIVEPIIEQTSTSPENRASQSAPKLPDSLQSFADTMKNFALDLPSMIDISGMSAELHTHSEPTIPENAAFLRGTLNSSQGSHDYRLYIPANYAQAVEQDLTVPLIVMLHGCTQLPEDFAVGTRMNELAEVHQCLIAYPSQPASANLNRCWNWFQPTHQKHGQGEPAWLAALTQDIINTYAVDASKVYIAGLSAGAAMAVIMAETYPEVYAAVGVHSGLAYRSATDLSSAMQAMHTGGSAHINEHTNRAFVPMIVFHGDQDHTVSIRNGEQLFEQAKQRLQAQKSSLNIQQHKPVSAQNCRSTQLQICDNKGVSQLEYWKIHGAGHSWAGGSSAGSYTDPKGPDASTEMLRFFLSR